MPISTLELALAMAARPSLVSLDTTSTTTHLCRTTHTLSDSLQIQRHSVRIERTQAELQVAGIGIKTGGIARTWRAFCNHLQLRLCPRNSNAVTLNLEGIWQCVRSEEEVGGGVERHQAGGDGELQVFVNGQRVQFLTGETY